jgi:integrase
LSNENLGGSTNFNPIGMGSSKKIGRIERQLNYAIKESGVVQFGNSEKGSSKKEAIQRIRRELISNDQKHGSHEIAKINGFQGKGHYKNAYATMRSFARYLDEKKVDNLQDFGVRRIQEFLKIKVEEGVKYEHYVNIEGHFTKMEGVLNAYFENKGIDKDLRIIDKAKDFSRDYAKEHLERGVEARSYKNAQNVIDGLDREDHRLVASIQLESGARVNEASLIDEKRLGGIQEYRGEEVGVIHLQKGDAKGGLERDLRVTKELYEKIEKYVKDNGRLYVGRGHARDQYRSALKVSAESAGQKYTGSHGLRHNYAQNRMEELTSGGMGHRIALTTVSVEMGHFREEITKHYLRT